MKAQVAPYETRALCLRIECTDGVTVIRLTRYPVDLTMSNGRVYQTGTGFDFTGYQATSSMSPSAIDLEGFVGYAGITRARIASGVFDNARCYLYACNFLSPVEDYEPIVSSILGKVTLEDDKYKIEEMSLVDVLNQSVGKTYTAQCPKTFGGTEYAGCAYPIANCTVSGTITSVTNNYTFTDNARAEAADYFGLGTIRFTSGLNTIAPDDGGDPYFANVVLGMHMDGADNGTTFTDVKGKAITRNGTTIVTKTGVKQFGSSSLYSDGASTGNNLTAVASTDFAVNSGAFTIDMWVRPLKYNSSGGRIASAAGTVAWNSTTGIHWLVQTDATGIQYQYYIGGTIAQAIAVTAPVGGFYHFAVTYDLTTTRVFIDGTKVGESVVTPVAPSSAPSLGIFKIPEDASAVTNAFTGYVDDFRITKGICRWTSDFTPPTAQFPEKASTPVSVGTREIKSYGVGGVIEVYEPFYYTVAPGDTYIMTGGCRKRLADCRDKWNNVVNFGGFSFIPTSSQYTQVGTK